MLPRFLVSSVGSREGGHLSSMALDPSTGGAGTSDSLSESTSLKSELPFQNDGWGEAALGREEGIPLPKGYL